MKHNLKKITLLFITAMLLGSCEKDEIYEKRQNSNSKPKIREVKFNELFKKDKKFSSLFEKITSTNQRSSFENQHGFTILDGNVKVIEYNSITSYTMLINRDNVTDDSFFENLVIQEDNNANQKAVLIKYTPTSITNSIDNSFIFEGTIQKSRAIHFSGLNKTNFENTTNSDCYVEYTMCNWGGTEHHAGANCTQTYTKRVKVNCIDEGGSGNGSGGDDDFWSGGSGNDGFDDPHGGGGGSADGDPFASPSQDEENETITSPVKPGLSGNLPSLTPCNKVKNITNNTPNLKDKINNFKTPQVLNLNYEKGFNFVDDNQNKTQLIQNDGSVNSTFITVTVPEDGSMSGLLHSHFDRPDMLPTFTFEDLMTFNAIYQWRKYNQKSQDKLTLMVVTRAGVFAMMIENESMFDTNGYNLWTEQNAQLRDNFNKSMQEKQNLTDEDVIIEVTKGLANYGIGLYQANSDISNWSKITVDANNNKVTTPCN
ncbi:hypothetical protein DPN68_02725 [Flavobacterium tibetense]|uniref:Lipoprotein n=2 Tax=Flavobacterium tibetense TaxID=2233533 RepID=A0A365P4Q2_9FLAO|nr:hypothetical protein DPN68_02725 [Flavobacterium tibetense]